MILYFLIDEKKKWILDCETVCDKIFFENTDAKMLVLKKCIGKGAFRECYEHPDDKSKCVKIFLKKEDRSVFQREFKNYSLLKDQLKDYIIPCEKELVETDKGMGMVCDLVRDDDGSASKMIWKYQMDDEIKQELDKFTSVLLSRNLFFYDFNENNFIIQIKDGKKKLKFIDLKSYRRNKSWTFLKLENVFDFLARIIMKRRLKRLYRDFHLEGK